MYQNSKVLRFQFSPYRSRHKAIPIKVSRRTFCTYQTDAKIYMGRQRNHSNQRKLGKRKQL